MTATTMTATTMTADAILALFARDPSRPYAIGELVARTGLRRGDVITAVAALASEGRVHRDIHSNHGGALTVTWRWRMADAPRTVAVPAAAE